MDIGPATNVEDRILSLEREANFWRVRFEELDKWRENLEDWVLANFGFHIRSNTSTGGNGTPIKFTTNSQISSPSNGWSPDSSDVSSRINLPNNNFSENGKRRGRRKLHDIDYKEADDGDDLSNNVSVPKRKRGRPKKTHAVSVITCAPGPNTSGMGNSSTSFSNDGIVKTDSCDIPQWDTSTMEENGNPLITVPVKRGRGRPKKVRNESGDASNEDGEQQKKKPGRKKRENGMPSPKTCLTCVLEFENNQDLLAHKRIVHPEKFHKCTICSESYLHAGFLARHMETHTLDKDYRCHLCISSFNTYQLLKGHCLEKHGVDLGRQSDWKRDNELVMSLKMKTLEFGQNESYGHQPTPGSQSQSMMSSPSSNCGHGSDIGRSDLVNHTNPSPHSQHQQQQQQQQHHQHSIIRQLSQHNPHHQPQLHQQHHMQQQQTTSPPLVHHPQQLSQHHHHHPQQALSRSHHHHHHHHRMADDDEDVDIEGGFPLDFGGSGPDTLPALFDPSSNEGAMGNYLNSMEPDSMQLY